MRMEDFGGRRRSVLPAACYPTEVGWCVVDSMDWADRRAPICPSAHLEHNEFESWGRSAVAALSVKTCLGWNNDRGCAFARWQMQRLQAHLLCPSVLPCLRTFTRDQGRLQPGPKSHGGQAVGMIGSPCRADWVVWASGHEHTPRSKVVAHSDCRTQCTGHAMIVTANVTCSILHAAAEAVLARSHNADFPGGSLLEPDLALAESYMYASTTGKPLHLHSGVTMRSVTA